MKKTAISIFMIALAGLFGCASTEKAPAVQNANAQPEKMVETTTGSRIPRATTDRVVKSTERDLSNEPVRSIGNTVGQK